MNDETAKIPGSGRADDDAQVRKIVEDWALLRDAGAWEAFAGVWHADGWMTATWFQGPYREFIRVSRSMLPFGLILILTLDEVALITPQTRETGGRPVPVPVMLRNCRGLRERAVDLLDGDEEAFRACVRTHC